jgi:universal stress protein E
MQPVSSILVVVDRSPAAADALAKGILLARKLEARVDLFMCDAERGFALSQAYVPTGVEEARHTCVADTRRYLEALKQAAAAPDVPISIDAACESPLYETIVRKVMREHHDVVIKNATHMRGQYPVRFDITDWQLMRTCPATLILTRGRAWSKPPRFAAAIDVSVAESAGLAHGILTTAQVLADCAGGELDVVYAEPIELGDQEREQGSRTLRDLVGQMSGTTPGVHILAGNPEASLPGFTKRRGYDALLLGALTHQAGYTAQVGTLTSRLVEAVDSDFILVKPSAYRSPVSEKCLRGSAMMRRDCDNVK